MAWYAALGHRPRRVGRDGGDLRGVDVIVEANNGETWAVQCRRGAYIDEGAVRGLAATMAQGHMARGIIVTTGSVSAGARRLAREGVVTVYDGAAFRAAFQAARAEQRTLRPVP